MGPPHAGYAGRWVLRSEREQRWPSTDVGAAAGPDTGPSSTAAAAGV